MLFFAAFLPQFTSASAPTAPQIVLLGLVFAVMELVSDSVWATIAAGLGCGWPAGLGASTRWARRVA